MDKPFSLEAIHAVLERAEEIEPYEQWAAFFSEDAEVWPIARDGKQLIGAVLFKHNTVHIAVLPVWHGRWITKSMLLGFREWAHKVPIIAGIPHDKTEAIELARRLGFVRQGEANGFEYWIKEAQPCHQQ